MIKKLYVGNLPFSATEEEVRELFAQHGTVESLAWITDRDTGRFRGFCFIEMDESTADTAIEELNGYDFGGRELRVNVAKPRDDQGKRGGRRRGGYQYRDNYQDRW